MKRKIKSITSFTLFARGVVYLVGFAALAVCTILLPELVREESIGKPVNLYLTYSLLGSAYVMALPFFIALYQTLKFLTYIDRNMAFSNRSIKALQNIKTCAIVFSMLVVVAVGVGVSLSRSMNPTEDVTPFIAIGFILTFVSSVIAIFVAVLQKLLTEAVALKSENDLIV
jgi:hypothetical protein